MNENQHSRAIALLQEQIRVYEANGRLEDMEPGERAREAAAIAELRESVKALEFTQPVDWTGTVPDVVPAKAIPTTG
jgi:hypothetical protein